MDTPTFDVEPKRLFLIDLMPILYRGYFVFLNKPRRTATGINTSSLSLFATTLDQILRTFKPTHLAIAMESATPTFRHALYPPYKAQREKMPEDIAAAIGQAQELAEAWGIKVLHVDGYEADDILGTLADRAAKAGFEVTIASPDKDLGQLAGEHIRIYRPGEHAPLSAEEVCAQWHIAFPAQLIDYLALAGDVSDNVPGIPGVGTKTATRLIQEYGSVENLLDHAAEIPRKLGETIRANAEMARLSKRLVTIERHVPLEVTWEELAVPPRDAQRLGQVLRKYELNQVANRLGIAITAAQRQMVGYEALASEPQAPVAKAATLGEAAAYATAAGEDAWRTLAQQAGESGSIAIAFDYTGDTPRTGHLTALALCAKAGAATYLPLPPAPEEHPACLEPLRALLEDPARPKVVHDAKTLRTLLAHAGLKLAGPVHDTLLEHYLLEATDRHELAHVAAETLAQPLMPMAQGSATEAALCERADATFRLDAALRPQVEARGQGTLLTECEEPLSEVLFEMEQRGVRLDPAALRRFRSELEGEIVRLELELRSFTGAGINLASPKQMGEFLFGELALDPTVKRTARGQYPTNEELLLKIRDRHPIIDLFLDWRACVKLKNTYVDRLPEHISPADGRIHTTFNQAFTDTGRLSSSDPNLQNIPVRTDRGQRIRAAFVARGPGWQLLSADYSQVELRLMAAMSGDEQLVGAFLRGEDIHAQTASAVYGIPLEAVTARQRSHCKMVNFGIIYGISSFGLASRLRIPRKEAQELIDTYFGHYPAVKAYMERTVAEARERGYAQTLFGRRRDIPEITSRNLTTRNAAERIAINMPIQGTAADIIKFAMVRIDRELRERGLQTRMTLQIHDELLFDVPDAEVETVRPLIQQAMERVISLPVPLQVSIGLAQDWLSAH